MMIIKSIIDNDLYKFTMQAAVLELFPDAEVEYKFKNRGKQRFTPAFLNILQREVQNMALLNLSKKEEAWIRKNLYFLKPQYIDYLKNYRFNPSQVKISLDQENNLEITIKGLWRETILWEVPLMALISELYFMFVDKDWEYNSESVKAKAYNKIHTLCSYGCFVTDFGTRRRRSFLTQEEVVETMSEFQKTNNKPCFIGTSNVYLAMKYNLKAIGSVAHEWTQAMQALESLNHCNYYAMQNWIKVYNTSLGIYLPDTITTDMFLQNFNRRFAMLFDGIRHDSDDPYKFVDKIVQKYKDLNIDPLSKFIIFSDNLDVDKAIEIENYCRGKIKCSFGIGTNFTNDFEESKPLNMVIKLWSVNGFPVVKLSDVEGKENGDPEAVKTMKWIVKNQLQNKENNGN